MNAFYLRFVGALLVAVIVTSLLASAVFAQEAPDTLPETGRANLANEYSTHLDQLRATGVRSAGYLAHPAVYEYSSDLQQLNAAAAAQTHQAATANDYITTLDQLRSLR